MMCRTIVHPLLHWFLEELQHGLFVYFEGVEKLCLTQCCDQHSTEVLLEER